MKTIDKKIQDMFEKFRLGFVVEKQNRKTQFLKKNKKEEANTSGPMAHGNQQLNF